jgi:HAD superfamily phosphatase (TIGR01668 family)
MNAGVWMILELFEPDLMVDSYQHLDPETLLKKGIRLLICDVDNTLSANENGICPPAVHRFVSRMEKEGIEVVLMTNNTRKHLNQVLKNHPKVKTVTFACKPLGFSYRRLLKEKNLHPDQCAVLGDQLFTDVAGGNRMGFYTVQSKPLTEKDRLETKVARIGERIVQKALAKRRRKRGRENV